MGRQHLPTCIFSHSPLTPPNPLYPPISCSRAMPPSRHCQCPHKGLGIFFILISRLHPTIMNKQHSHEVSTREDEQKKEKGSLFPSFLWIGTEFQGFLSVWHDRKQQSSPPLFQLPSFWGQLKGEEDSFVWESLETTWTDRLWKGPRPSGFQEGTSGQGWRLVQASEMGIDRPGTAASSRNSAAVCRSMIVNGIGFFHNT